MYSIFRFGIETFKQCPGSIETPYVFWVSRIQIIIFMEPDPSIKKQKNIYENLDFFAFVTSQLLVQLWRPIKKYLL